jgi:YfiH family protein
MKVDLPTGWAPEWPVSGVGAWMSHRLGGCSAHPFDSLNLGAAVGDDPQAVGLNRQRFQHALGGAVPVFLKQVHGVRVLTLNAGDAAAEGHLESIHEADAAVTSDQGVACVIQVADCLPVLFAGPQGRAVGAAHAGWRGLALGVLEATLKQVCELACCQAAEIDAWLGPCIGPRWFEVGNEVLEALSPMESAFMRPDLEWPPDNSWGHLPQGFKPGIKPGKYGADLPALARARLVRAGLEPARVYGGQWCTYEDRSRFFSFRRDGITGRLAAAIWRAL